MNKGRINVNNTGCAQEKNLTMQLKKNQRNHQRKARVNRKKNTRANKRTTRRSLMENKCNPNKIK